MKSEVIYLQIAGRWSAEEVVVHYFVPKPLEGFILLFLSDGVSVLFQRVKRDPTEISIHNIITVWKKK